MTTRKPSDGPLFPFFPLPTPGGGATGAPARGGCVGCRQGSFGVDISMAFQPIVDVAQQRVFAYEALVRGPNAEGAGWVLSQVHNGNRYGFDQTCRVRAIELAASLHAAEAGALLSINFLPNAVYRPEACIRTTFEAARRTGFPLHALLFEVTEVEEITDAGHLKRILEAYREMGFRTAIDDFGAGHSGLGLLADFQPDIVKLDMKLVRGSDADPVRRAILRGAVSLAHELNIAVIAEGIETAAEYGVLRDMGVTLFQGYLFARPGFEALPDPAFPEAAAPAKPVLEAKSAPKAALPA